MEPHDPLDRRVASRGTCGVAKLRSPWTGTRTFRTLGIDHHEPPQAFATALGFQISKIAEGEVQHAALPRTHGGKTIRLRCAADPLRRRLRGQLKLPRAQRLEGIRVKGDGVVL